MAVAQQTTVVAALTGGAQGFATLFATVQQPLDAAAAAAVGAGVPAVLTAGTIGPAAVASGLNGAGIGAVASAAGTYYSALSQAKRNQLGYAAVHILPGGLSVTVHSADVASFGATLAAVLNSAGNYGAVSS
jgi:hypothetical protein